jgi:hypothetical protein
MPDSGSKTSPVRALTVKNFSVIKDAITVPLEFGKITVLIGPQASGKSLLCKLAYFLSKQVIEDALVAILNPNSIGLSLRSPFDEFKASVSRNFLSWFPPAAWWNEDARVIFQAHSFRVEANSGTRPDVVEIEFSKDFEALFESLVDVVQRAPAGAAESRKYVAEQVRAQLYLLLTDPSLPDPFIDRPVYIPDGRAFFSNQSLGFNTVSNPDIDPVLREFSLELSWGNSRPPNPILGDEGVRVLEKIRRDILKLAGGSVERHNGFAQFRRALDGRSIPFPLLSSGTQAVLPMLNVIWQLIADQRDRIIFPRPDNLSGMPNKIIVSKGLVYLEEPEANIFPSTTNEFVRLFAWISQEWRLGFSWVITTHSPYILSSFNNLILAGQLGRDRRLRKKIKIDDRYWIEPGTFKAYSIHDGKLESILSNSGLIDGDYLDSVSETIGNEFDEMLRLEYGKKKAS